MINTHKGTTQVRKFRIYLLFEMITRLTSLVDKLSSLKKVISTEKQVEKVLRVFPKSKWDVKVTTIKKEKDLTKMSLNELVGNLKTYEMSIDEVKRDKAAKKNSLALKEFDSDESKLDQEQVAFITSNFSKFFKKMSSNKKQTGSKKWSNDN